MGDYTSDKHYLGPDWKINCEGIWFSLSKFLTTFIRDCILNHSCSFGSLPTSPPTVWNEAKWINSHKSKGIMQYIYLQYSSGYQSTATPETSHPAPSQMWKLCDGDLARWPQDSYQLRRSRWWQLQHNRTCSNTTHPRHIMSAQYLPQGTAVLHYTPLRWGD